MYRDERSSASEFCDVGEWRVVDVEDEVRWIGVAGGEIAIVVYVCVYVCVCVL